MAQSEMTIAELFAETRAAHLSLVHLDIGVEEAIARIAACSNRVSNQVIHKLLREGDSWRERLLGLVFAVMRGVDQFYDSLVASLHRTGGISIVPICAVLAVAVRDCGCKYDTTMTATLDRHRWDGEIGFALDWFHQTIGIEHVPTVMIGPNYGQYFTKHLEFYANQNKP